MGVPGDDRTRISARHLIEVSRPDGLCTGSPGRSGKCRRRASKSIDGRTRGTSRDHLLGPDIKTAPGCSTVQEPSAQEGRFRRSQRASADTIADNRERIAEAATWSNRGHEFPALTDAEGQHRRLIRDQRPVSISAQDRARLSRRESVSGLQHSSRRTAALDDLLLAPPMACRQTAWLGRCQSARDLGHRQLLGTRTHPTGIRGSVTLTEQSVNWSSR